MLQTNVRPREDWVFVQKEPVEEESSSGIVVVEDRPSLEYGVILAAGPGRVEDGAVVPMEVVPGDRVMFNRYAGTDFGRMGERDYVFLKHGEILAKVL